MGTDSADLFGRENVDAHESMCGCEPLRHFSGKRLEIGQSIRRGPMYAGRIDPCVAVGGQHQVESHEVERIALRRELVGRRSAVNVHALDAIFELSKLGCHEREVDHS